MACQHTPCQRDDGPFRWSLGRSATAMRGKRRWCSSGGGENSAHTGSRDRATLWAESPRPCFAWRRRLRTVVYRAAAEGETPASRLPRHIAHTYWRDHKRTQAGFARRKWPRAPAGSRRVGPVSKLAVSLTSALVGANCFVCKELSFHSVTMLRRHAKS